MTAKSSPGARLFSALAVACAALFVFSASKCDSVTTFPAYVAEICTDNIDNDGDSLIDCKDPDCARDCRVSVAINPIASPVTKDSLAVSGTQSHATSVVVSIVPSGTGGTATLGAETWTANLANVSALTTYTVTAVATDALGNLDTATTTFTRGN